MIQGPPLEVHGESHHRAEIEAAIGRRPEGHQDVVDAALVWEPDNQWDANAIAVQVAMLTRDRPAPVLSSRSHSD